jgi:hypothetical protein
MNICSRMNETNATTKVVEPYLYIVKNSSAMGSYDDGIYIKFADNSPQHITFEFYTEDADIETCDFRLTS